MKWSTAWKRNRLYIVSAIVLILSIYIIGVILTSPYIGIHVHQNSEGQWVVSDVEEHSWGWHRNIQPGTVILEIDGRSPEENETVTMFQTIENASSITVLLDNPTLFDEIEEDVSVPQYFFYLIIPLLFMVMVFFIAIFIFYHRRDDKSGEYIIVFFYMLGLAYLASSGAARTEFVSTIVNTSAVLLTPVLFVRFLSTYFHEVDEDWIPKWIYRMMTMVAFVVTGIEACLFIFHVYPDWYLGLISSVFIVFTIIVFVFVIKGKEQFKHTPNSNIFQYLFVGILLSVGPYIFLTLIPAYTIGVKLLEAEWSLLFLIAFPLMFLYLITAKRLFDIEFVIGRIRYYSYVSILPAIMILLFVMMLVPGDWNVQRILQLLCLIWVTFIAFLYVKELFDFQLQQNLFTQKNNYQQSMHQFVQKIKKEKDPVDLYYRLSKELKDVMGIEEIHFFSKSVTMEMYGVHYPIQVALMKECAHRIDEENGQLGEVVKLKKHEGYALMIGYTVNKLTYLYCSEKPNNTALNVDEKSYIQAMTHNTHIAIENLILMENMLEELEQQIHNQSKQKYPAWLSRLLFSLTEHQRQQIAVDLHDTVLQEQLYIYRQMDDFLNRYDGALTDDVMQILKGFREQMLDNIHLIRETCNELRPPFLEEMGLIPSLENLVSQYQLRSNFTVQFDYSNFKMEIENEYVLAIYRIVQELLTNAMKHSQADEVYLSLEKDGANVLLLYQDNGIGMRRDKSIDLFAHMGLSGIEQRVNGLNGEVVIDTKPNGGFHVKVTLYDVR
ncbi:ATP-binding protein [Pontibacillus litoralis]|uniref:Histidine kinase domain-containing protein n=1 Tax=Pontibacillus litoralis JSM 072002 TaxID=1385512 RepID=A0A0A5I023_9BACI|nr:ATP-binding protein [Pontibacillus litoralis]KGX89207.1 hypothetical protein N784_01560 [Pontibacillus litoralis JSM 072002]